MPETFESVWRVVKTEAPVVPTLLLRQWAQEGFSRLCEDWGWAFLRTEGTITVQAARTVSVTFVQGSTTITSAAGFLSTDAGRQLRVTRLPIYTIDTVVNASTATLTSAYTEAGATSDATIFDGYFICPANFRRFLVILDRYYMRVIPFWMTEDDVAVADPGRYFSDTGPRYLVSADYSPATDTLGRVRYEFWPSPTSFRTYPYLYIRRPDQLADTSLLPGVLSERGELLRLYVRAQAAGWPGTADQQNPYYDLASKMALLKEWEIERGKLENNDDNEYPQQLMLIHWERRVGGIAPVSQLLRATDATLNDYY